jgi:hypothetical protein
MRYFKVLILLAATLAVFANFSLAQKRSSSRTRQNASNISDSQIVGGLKEALIQGVRRSVNELGREDGFFKNPRVKIPLPKNLQKVEKTLRFAGQGRKVDEFVEAMNRAAEKAVPEATDIFLDSIRQMTFDDARKILFSGKDDAATEFFRRTSEERLRQRFRPIVENFTSEVGVTEQYKALFTKYGFLGRVVGEDASDIDGYVTQKALDGLFLLIAEEERKIRRDPIGRTTDLLRVVFGSIIK